MTDNFWVRLGAVLGIRTQSDGAADVDDNASDDSFFDTIVSKVVDEFQEHIISPVQNMVNNLPTISVIVAEFESNIVAPVISSFQEHIVEPILASVGTDWTDKFLDLFAYNILEDAWHSIVTPVINTSVSTLNKFTSDWRNK